MVVTLSMANDMFKFVSLKLKTSRATQSVGDPWTRPCNPEKIWATGQYFALIRGWFSPGSSKRVQVGNRLVFSFVADILHPRG